MISLIVYSLIGIFFIPIFCLNLLIRIIKKKEEINKILERFSLGSNSLEKNKDTIWFHAASVGESRSIFKLIQIALQDGKNVLVTTMTRTSSDLINNQFSNQKNFLHTYIPFDSLPFVLLFFFRYKPKKIIFVESEIWPLFLHIGKIITKGNVYLINGSLSDSSYQKWMKAKKIGVNIFSVFNVIFPKEQNLILKFINLKGNTHYIGDIKNDYLPIKSNLFESKELKSILPKDKKIILLASIHPGEEEKILNQIENELDKYFLIFAPRHQNNLENLKKFSQRYNLLPVLLTQIDKNINFNSNSSIICDQMGNMSLLYDVSDFVLIGGSLIDGIGGHNPLEPINHEKLTAIGKFHSKCAGTVENLLKFGILQIVDGNLSEIIKKSLENKDEIEKKIQQYILSRRSISDEIYKKMINFSHCLL